MVNTGKLAENVQIVINTLEQLNIQATQDNLNKLLGSIQLLTQIRNELAGEGDTTLQVLNANGEVIHGNDYTQ